MREGRAKVSPIRGEVQMLMVSDRPPGFGVLTGYLAGIAAVLSLQKRGNRPIQWA